MATFQANTHTLYTRSQSGTSTNTGEGMLSNFSNPSVGQRNVVPPSSNALSSDDRHAMDEVIKAIEARKTADETAIKDCLKNKA